jgi:hypothetical protein
MATKRLVWSDWSKGFSQTPHLAPEGSYYDMSNLDGRTCPGSVKLGPALVNLYTNADNNTFISSDSSGNIVSGTDDNKLFVGFSQVTYTAGSDPLGIFYMEVSGTEYQYVLRAAAIDRFTSSWVLDTASHRTYTSSSSTYRPICQDGTSRVLFGGGRYVYEFNNLEVVTEKLRIPKGQEIVSISKFNDQFRIYARGVYGQNNESYLYIWDGVSASHNYVASLYGAMPLGVGSFAGYDILVGGYNKYYSDIYKMSGLQYTPIFSQSDGSDRRTMGAYGPIATDRGNFFIPYEQIDTKKAVAMYGSEFSGYGDALHHVIGGLDNVFVTERGTSRLYIAGMSGSNYGVYYINLANDGSDGYQTSGHVTSNINWGGDKTTLKKITGIRLDVSGTGTVTLKATRDVNAANFKTTSVTYSTLATVTAPSSNSPGITSVYVPQSSLTSFQPSVGWAYRLELSGNFYTTPTVHNIETIFEDEVSGY